LRQRGFRKKINSLPYFNGFLLQTTGHCCPGVEVKI
jgi:hypothetical protein